MRALLLLVALVVTGCGLSIPSDPDGTLDRVRDQQVLRAGASPSSGWVDVAGEQPTGPEVELVGGFAESVGAEVEWTVGGEEELVGELEHGRLDLLVGGLTDQNPWVEKGALTRAYAETKERGTTKAHVMMVPLGENAFQSALERWLDENAPPVTGVPVP